MLSFLLTAMVLAAPPSPAPPRTLTSFCEEAIRKFGEGDLNGGFELLDAAQKAYPGGTKPHWLRAQVLMGIAGFTIWCVYGLCKALAVGPALWIVAMFIPLVNLICLVALNRKATSYLKGQGVRVGLLGAKN